MSVKMRPIKTRRQFTGMEKARAVLSIWAERRKPAEICQEMDIRWAHLNNWQNRALAGMLGALEVKKEKEKVPALGDRLRKLLDRQMAAKEHHHSRLQQRLEKIQQGKETPSVTKK